jgi:hypothetical protein
MGFFGQAALSHDESYVAETDLSAKQFYCVKPGTTSPQVALAGAGNVVVGILQNKPKAGEAAAVRLRPGDISQAVVDATTDIAYGDALKADANGKLVKTTTDKDFVVARAQEPATEDGQIIAVKLELAYFAA